jgi:hypothetical protein
MDQIRSDCHLLMSLKIMDYSLLLGIHYRQQEAKDRNLSEGKKVRARRFRTTCPPPP